MKKMILFLFLAKFAFAFDINELVSYIKTEDIRGDFRQIKQISGFGNSLVSSGNFSLKNGVFEQNTTKPVSLSIKVNEDGVFEFDGKKYSKISPLFDKELFLNILSLNLSALRADFDYSLSGDMSGWSIELKPKKFISKIFESIIISGDKFIKSMVLNETSKDVTRYEFFDIKALY